MTRPREDGHGADSDQRRRIDEAFRAGDLAALRAAVDNPDAIPNGAMPPAIGSCLEYAIYRSPVAFIRTLLEAGAEPNPPDPTAFPPLLAAVLCSRSTPDEPGRADAAAVVEVLLAFGADPNGRGLHDETPLEVAVAFEDLRLVRLLVAAGADPRLSTGSADGRTPLDLARAKRCEAIVALFEGR